MSSIFLSLTQKSIRNRDQDALRFEFVRARESRSWEARLTLQKSVFRTRIGSGLGWVCGSGSRQAKTVPKKGKIIDCYLGCGPAAVHGVSSDNVLSVRRPVQPQHMGRPSTLLHTHTHSPDSWCCGDPDYVYADSSAGFLSVLPIRIRMRFGPLAPDPLVRDTDPDPDLSIIKQK